MHKIRLHWCTWLGRVSAHHGRVGAQNAASVTYCPISVYFLAFTAWTPIFIFPTITQMSVRPSVHIRAVVALTLSLCHLWQLGHYPSWVGPSCSSVLAWGMVHWEGEGEVYYYTSVISTQLHQLFSIIWLCITSNPHTIGYPWSMYRKKIVWGLTRRSDIRGVSRSE